jgi:hypothetical protein
MQEMSYRLVSRVDEIGDYENGNGVNSQLATNKSRPVHCPGMNRKVDFISSLFKHEQYTPKVESKIDFLLQLSESDFKMVFVERHNSYDEMIGYDVNYDGLNVVLDIFENTYKQGVLDEVEDYEDEDDYKYEKYFD